jgi:hypothetical protein
LFEDGKMFDGSSIAGWKGINESDMVLMPDPATAVLDPFTADTDADPDLRRAGTGTMQAYSRDPRGTAKRAEAYLKSSGIADRRSSGRSRNSSSSTACAGQRHGPHLLRSIRKKRTGTRARNTKAATPAIVRW